MISSSNAIKAEYHNDLNAAFKNCFEQLSEEYSDLHSKEIDVVDKIPTALEFSRNWVSRNVPVLIKNGIKHWPALKKWNNAYLRSKLQGQKFTVAVTPNGYADAVLDNLFVLPEERIMTFDSFLEVINNPKPFKIFYIQKQNNNMFQEFNSLLGDIDSHVHWATEALGKTPDAVNFWMGDKRAVTSLHKDHYENIYCVVKGKKEFILHPPIDMPWIPYRNYDVGIFHYEDDNYSILKKDEKVKWIPVDPLHPDFDKYPMYRNAKPYYCTVEEGDILYLPALWYHHVSQSHRCIAVNYWYDMNFDIKYCYYKLLENITNLQICEVKD